MLSSAPLLARKPAPSPELFRDNVLGCCTPVNVTAWPATVVLLLTVSVVVVSADWMFWSSSAIS